MRLAELLGLASLASDAGMGLPESGGLRMALLAVGLAAELGLDAEVARDAYDLALLQHLGCTADADLAADVMHDEVATRGAMLGTHWAEAREVLPFVLRTTGRGEPWPRRLARLLHTLRTMPKLMDSGAAHCEVGEMLAGRLGLGAGVRAALLQVFECWNGAGTPRRLRGEAIALPVRVMHVAQEAEIGLRLGGPDGAVALVRRRSGRALDPRLAAAFVRAATPLCAALEVPSTWRAALDAEPAPHRTLGPDEVERALGALADFADLKSRYTRTHSRGVAALAAEAGRRVGLASDELRDLRRAGLLHDLGRPAVTAALWDKRGVFTDEERERARHHAYCGERILARSEALSAVAAIATLGHERLDGSGYHRRLDARATSFSARLLAAADARHAMGEERPHRLALTPERAADELRREVRAGRLDGDAVAAVLAAEGRGSSGARERPAGLTEREVEVLRLVAVGQTNKEIATALSISTKTAGHHLEHIFRKIGVTTRAAASMYAMQHALLPAVVGAG